MVGHHFSKRKMDQFYIWVFTKMFHFDFGGKEAREPGLEVTLFFKISRTKTFRSIKVDTSLAGSKRGQYKSKAVDKQATLGNSW